MPWANAGDYLGTLNNVRHAIVEDLAAAEIKGAPALLVAAAARERPPMSPHADWLQDALRG